MRRSARSIRPSSSSLGSRHARAEEELAAVGVEVGGQQGDALGLERLLDGADDRVQPLGQGLRALLCENGVGAGEPHEARWWRPGARGPAAPVPRTRRGRSGRGSRIRCSASGGTDAGRPGSVRGSRRRSSSAPSSRGRVLPRGSRAAVAAADDDLAGVGGLLGERPPHVAPGPSTSSSRVGEPTRKQLDVAGVHARPTSTARSGRRTSAPRPPSRSEARISTAASQACSGWSVAAEEEEQRVAAELEQLAAAGGGDGRASAPKTRLRVSTISSAPIRPCRDSRSVRAVNPDTSAKTSVPSTVRCSAPGASSSQTSVSGGTWRRRSVIGRAPFVLVRAGVHPESARLPHAQGVEPADPPSAGAQGGLVRVDFLGVRGSVCAPGRDFVRYGGNTSCVAVSTAPARLPTLVLDAGTGIRGVTRHARRARRFAASILVSHLHWDHVRGCRSSRPATGPAPRSTRPARPGRQVRARPDRRRHVAAGLPDHARGTARRLDLRRRAPGRARGRGLRGAASRSRTRAAHLRLPRAPTGALDRLRARPRARARGLRRRARRAGRASTCSSTTRSSSSPSGRAAVDYGHATVDDAIRLAERVRRRHARAVPPRPAPHRRRPRRDRAAVHGVDPDRHRGRRATALDLA